MSLINDEELFRKLENLSLRTCMERVMNKLPNLQAWCDKERAKDGIKMHPQSAPLAHVIEEMLGSLDANKEFLHNLLSIYSDLNSRITLLEKQAKDSPKELEDAPKLTKPKPKVDKKEVKK